MLGVEGMFRGLKMVAGWFFRGLTRVSQDCRVLQGFCSAYRGFVLLGIMVEASLDCVQSCGFKLWWFGLWGFWWTKVTKV